MTVSVSSDLPLPPDVVAGLVAKPATLRHVTWPLLTFPDPLPTGYDRDTTTTLRLRALGVVPLWTHTVRVVHADPEAGVAVTEEHGGPLRRWRHRLDVAALPAGGCRYTDTVDLDAGRLTPIARLLTRAFFRYRHRRWAALARVLA